MAEAARAVLGGGFSAARPLRILLSYHYFKAVDLDALAALFAGYPLDVLGDSGAYSAFTTGATITVAEYAAWLNRWAHIIPAAAALDVIGDAPASVRQARELRALVDPRVEVVPVFHSTDGDWSYLDAYQREFSYIGISPIGHLYKNPELLDAWLAEAFARRRPEVRYHGFGVTGTRTLRFPWHSADSSTYSTFARFVELNLWHEARARYVRVPMRNRRAAYEARELLAAYHLRPGDLMSMGTADVRAFAASIRAHRAAEQWYAAHGGARALFLALQAGGGNGPPNVRAALDLIRAQDDHGH